MYYSCKEIGSATSLISSTYIISLRVAWSSLPVKQTGPAFKESICWMRNGFFSFRGKETRKICSMTMTQRCERVYKRSERLPRICFEATCQMKGESSLIRSRLRRTSLNDDFATWTKNGGMIKLDKYRLTADINDSKLLYNLFRDVYGPLSSPVNTFAQKNWDCPYLKLRWHIEKMERTCL